MINLTEIRPGAYYDSVVLMQLQRQLAALPGVDDAGVVMATPANKELLKDFDLLTEDGDRANPDDLLIVVRAATEKDGQTALSQIDELLKRRRSSVSEEFRPKSLDAAVKQLPEASLVMISVPGRYAAGVADEALHQGKHVFLYSDNVSLEDELKLKEKGRQAGLLVMGPDCGTAIINGIGLGFANRVRTGSIGVVGASGTGIQAITSEVHNLGGGISHAIGTGGRDLKGKIGAITASQGLDLLARDDNTKVIVIVSKPPDPEIAADLLGRARAAGKPVVINFIGFPPPARSIGNLYFAASLDEAAQLAVELSAKPAASFQEKPSDSAGFLRGLFSGGTLAYEAMLGFQTILSPIFSNVPIIPEQKLDDPLSSKSHTVIDLGEDVFTQGRLHPMMDNDLRIRRLRQELEDPVTGVILLDIVLGEGSHPDPASELAPEIARGKKARPEIDFLIVMVGTDEDPQGIDEQSQQFIEAGAKVFRKVSEVIAYLGVSQSTKNTAGVPVSLESIQSDLAAINIGVESFYDSLKSQGAAVVQVDWRPPAGGNEKLMDILARMKTG